MRIILSAKTGGRVRGSCTEMVSMSDYKTVTREGNRDGRQVRQSGASFHCYRAHGERHCAA